MPDTEEIKKGQQLTEEQEQKLRKELERIEKEQFTEYRPEEWE